MGLRRGAPTPAPAEHPPCASLRLQVRGRATLSRVTPGGPARQELHTPGGFHRPPRQRDPYRAPALPGLNPLSLVCTSTGTLRRGLSPGARERGCAQCHTTHSAPLPFSSPGAPNSRRPRRLRRWRAVPSLALCRPPHRAIPHPPHHPFPAAPPPRWALCTAPLSGLHRVGSSAGAERADTPPAPPG